MIISEYRNGKRIQRQVKAVFTEQCDVVVAGLGTAGAVAAIKAAELGLYVIGVEKFTSMGGMMTNGGVGSYYFGGTGGFFEEIEQQGKELKDYSGPERFSVDSRRYTLERLARERGVRALYQAVITGVFLEEKKVVGVRLFYKNTTVCIQCGAVIDCTGDCTVCYMAGCQTQFGRASDEVPLPFTSVRVYLENHQEKRTNFDCGIVDQRDAQELTRAIIRAHACHLREDYGEGEIFLGVCPLIGIREGRRIIGEEQMTLEKYFNGNYVKEPVFYAYADIDKHGTDTAFESRLFKDWYVCSNMGAANLTVPVSIKMMIPKGFDGIMAAGRCLCVDHDLSTCVRMNRDMQKCGEAAAWTVFLALQEHSALKEVDGSKLKSALLKSGCLSENPDMRIRLDGGSIKKPILVELSDDEKRVCRALSSMKPAAAIWTCRLYPEKYHGILKKNLESFDETLRKHSAIALGVAGFYDGREEIRNMIRERDGAVLRDMRKHNQIRGVIAVSLAGKFSDMRTAEELLDITEVREREKTLYQVHEQAGGAFNNTYFQFLSHSIAGLIDICESNQKKAEQILKRVCRNLEDESYIHFITQREPGTSEYEMALNLKLMAENAYRRCAGIK